VTDATEVVVVKAPGEPVDLRCGGRPLVAMDAEVTAQGIEAGFDGGTQLGKRYADEALGLEVLCTKGGDGALSVGETILEVKGAKPLPASD
jgi:nitroreductase